MSMSKQEKKSVAIKQVSEIAAETFFGEYSNCPKCNLTDVGFPKHLCNRGSLLLKRSTLEMKLLFISLVILELENNKTIREYTTFKIESPLLKTTTIGDSFAMVPLFTYVDISREPRFGLRMKIGNANNGSICEYYFIGDKLKTRTHKEPIITNATKELDLSGDVLDLLSEANWGRFLDTSSKFLYYDGKVFRDTKPISSYLLFAPDLPLPDDLCAAWIDIGGRPFLDFISKYSSLCTNTAETNKKILISHKDGLIKAAGEIFFGITSNCIKCNLLDAGFNMLLSKDVLLVDKIDVADKLELFWKAAFEQLEANGIVHEFSTFQAQTPILKACVGDSFGIIPCHTSVKIRRSILGLTLVVRRGHSADEIEYFYKVGHLQHRNTKFKLTTPSSETCKRLNTSKLAKCVLADVNAAMILNPSILLYYDGHTVSKIRPQAHHLIFGANTTNVFDEDPLVCAWVNTNFYEICDWISAPFLCVSYFGVADLNALKAYEVNSNQPWKRATAELSDVFVDDLDCLFFMGTECEWNLYTRNNLINVTHSIKRNTHQNQTQDKISYKRVYVNCVLIGEPLPVFIYNNNIEIIEGACTSVPWVVKNVCFETHEYKLFYDQVGSSEGEVKYYADTKLEKKCVYGMYLPRRKKTTNRTKSSDEIKIRCQTLCLCTKLRKNVNMLVHHADEHCETNYRCCVVGCNVKFGEINFKSKRKYHYIKCHKADTSLNKIINTKPVMLLKSRDTMRYAWQIGAQLKLITSTPIVGMDTELITDKRIYTFFMTQLNTLQDQPLAYAIMYALGMNPKPVSVGKLTLDISGAGLFRTRDHIVLVCRQLIEFNAIESANVHDQYEITHTELREITKDNALCDAVYLKRVVSELIYNFSRCLFDIDVLYKWFTKATAELSTYKSTVNSKKSKHRGEKKKQKIDDAHDTPIKIAETSYTTQEYLEFIDMFQQEPTKSKWFTSIGGKSHIHLDLMLSDATIEQSTNLATNSPTTETPLYKFVRLVIKAIEQTYTLDIDSTLIENRTETKQKFLMSHDLTVCLYAQDLIFDLATVVKMRRHVIGDFLVAIVPIRTNQSTSTKSEFEDIDKWNAPRQLAPPESIKHRLRNPLKPLDRIVFNVTSELQLLNKTFKRTPGYIEFRLFSNVCGVFREHDIPDLQFENLQLAQLKGMYRVGDEIYVCLQLMVEPAQSVALALLEYSGCFHSTPHDDLRKFNPKNCDTIFINGVKYFRAKPVQDKIYKRIVVDLTDEISYFIEEIIEMEKDLWYTTDVVFVCNVEGISSTVIKDVRIRELVAIRDGKCPGYYKTCDSAQNCNKIYAHLPSMGAVGRRIAIELMNYSTAYYNYDDVNGDLLAGDPIEICVGKNNTRVFYKALAYRHKHPVSSCLQDEVFAATSQDRILQSAKNFGLMHPKNSYLGPGIQLACTFKLSDTENISDLITNELLEKYPALSKYHTKVTSDLSMIFTHLDTTKMFRYWDNKYWPYTNILNGHQIKSNKKYSTEEREPIYTTYPKIQLTKLQTNQFPEMVERLSERERKVLTLVYKCYLCKLDAVDYDEMYSELRRISHDLQMRLIHTGMCIMTPGNKLLPNTLPAYINSHMQFLNEYTSAGPSKKNIYHFRVTASYHKSTTEMMRGITNYDTEKNYKQYFLQFHDPNKLSVPKCNINFNGRTAFLDLIDVVDPGGIYNVHTFLDYVDVVGYNSERSSLVVIMKVSLKYNTSKKNKHSRRDIRGFPTAIVSEFDISRPSWNEKKLEELKYQTEVFKDLTLTQGGFTWILDNLDKPISQQFLVYFIAESKPTDPDLFAVTCCRYIAKDIHIEHNYFCRVCVQFGNKHTNSTKHMGIQLKSKLKLDIWCNECKVDVNTHLNFGLCQGVDCGADVYANVCDVCVETADVMRYLCECHGQQPQITCKPGHHTGYTIVRMHGLCNKYCNVCLQYQGESQAFL